MIKLSIITINYNNATGLAKTIQSVIGQSWKKFEFIIIDGGSTDGSVDFIKQYQNELTCWISEPDRGVFHAMNKGILRARGEYLLMLNSGDTICNENVLKKIFEDDNPGEDILYGDVFWETKGKIFQESVFPDQLSFLFLHKEALSHQAAFIRRELHRKIGLYDETKNFCSDWSFFLLAICKYNASYKHIHRKIAISNCDGLTCNPSNFLPMAKERNRFLKEEFSAFIDDYKLLDNVKNKKMHKRISSAYSQFIAKCKYKLKLAWN